MKMIKKMVTMLTSMLLTLLIVGCTSLNGSGIEIPDQADIVNMPDGEYGKTIERIDKQYARMSHWREFAYTHEEPAHYGQNDTAYTMIWNKKLHQTTVYQGHITDKVGFGMEQYVLANFPTDINGDPLLDEFGKPRVTFNYGTSQSGTARLHEQVAAQIAGMAVQGVSGQALIAGAMKAVGKCTSGNCGGGTPTLIQNLVNSESVSGTTTDVGVGVALDAAIGACGAGGCGVPLQ